MASAPSRCIRVWAVNGTATIAMMINSGRPSREAVRTARVRKTVGVGFQSVRERR